MSSKVWETYINIYVDHAGGAALGLLFPGDGGRRRGGAALVFYKKKIKTKNFEIH